MNYRTLRHVSIAACLGILSCTPSTNVPGTELFLDAEDGKYHGPMESLRLEASAQMVEVAESITIKTFGIFEDGTEIAVGVPHVYWGIEGEGATLGEASGNTLTINGSVVGTPKVTAQLGTLKTALDVAVVPASLRELAINATTEIRRGGTGTLTVVGTFGDASTQDLTTVAELTSSDETLLQIQDDGTLVGVGVGAVTITATVDDVSATREVTVICSYPSDSPTNVTVGRTFPRTTWTNAVYPDGSEGPLDLEEVYCGDNEKFADAKTLFIQVSAEWCGPCRVFRREFNDNRELFDGNNSQFMVTEIRDRADVPNVTARSASNSVTAELGTDWGVRLGDAQTTPTVNLFNASRIIRVFPTFFVVRKRDMKLIAWSGEDPGEFYANYMVDILQNPEWDWTDLDNPLPQFVSNCSPGMEEAFEPNDTSATAKAIDGAVEIKGGICTEAPDYYKLNLTGRWRVTLLNDAAVGDIDVYAHDPSTGQRIMNGNFPVGAYTSESVDSFTHSGPALLRVEGKGTASAGYTLYVEEL